MDRIWCSHNGIGLGLGMALENGLDWVDIEIGGLWYDMMYRHCEDMRGDEHEKNGSIECRSLDHG